MTSKHRETQIYVRSRQQYEHTYGAFLSYKCYSVASFGLCLVMEIRYGGFGGLVDGWGRDIAYDSGKSSFP